MCLSGSWPPGRWGAVGGDTEVQVLGVWGEGRARRPGGAQRALGARVCPTPSSRICCESVRVLLWPRQAFHVP